MKNSNKTLSGPWLAAPPACNPPSVAALLHRSLPYDACLYNMYVALSPGHEYPLISLVGCSVVTLVVVDNKFIRLRCRSETQILPPPLEPQCGREGQRVLHLPLLQLMLHRGEGSPLLRQLFVISGNTDSRHPSHMKPRFSLAANSASARSPSPSVNIL